jgi:EAL domain-containing protein (putative c-di-GMP-specific phosphodiesterase class I)
VRCASTCGRALVRAIFAIDGRVGFQLIADGVRTQSERDALAELGVTLFVSGASEAIY